MTLGLAASAMLFAACGDDEDPIDQATDALPTSPINDDEETTTATTTPTTVVSVSGTLEVTAVDYAFEGLPDTIESGTMLTMVNNSDEEAHELVAIRLPDDEERPVSELIALPEEELGEIISTEPATVLIAAPGEESMAVVGDGTIEESGRYAIVCFIPVGADPAEVLAVPGPDATEPADGEPPGPPHASEGMYAELTVE